MKVQLSITFDILPTTGDKKPVKLTSRQAKKFITLLWNGLKSTGKWEKKLVEGRSEMYIAYALEAEHLKVIK